MKIVPCKPQNESCAAPDGIRVPSNAPCDGMNAPCKAKAELEVLRFESARLRNHPSLAKRIKHVAAEDVGAGYDILSFTESATVANFSDRLIEVKAVSAADFKFYWSRNEIEMARIHGSNYFLYLVTVSKFGFDIQKLKVVQNPFDAIFQNESGWQREHELISFWPK